MHLPQHALHQQRRRLHATDVRRHVSAHGEHPTLTAGAPKHLFDRHAERGRHAVGAARGDGDRIGEQNRLGIEDRGQFVVAPQRVQLGHVGQIQRALLEAWELQQDFEPIQDRIGVVVNLVETASRAVADGRARLLCPAWGHQPGVHADAAQADEAKRSPRHFNRARRFPKADLEADRRRRAGTEAQRVGRVVDVVLTHRDQARAADRHRHRAAPADVGDRIRELAEAGCAASIGQAKAHQGEQPSHESGDDGKLAHCGPFEISGNSSSTRRRLPSCATRAGTCAMPRRRTSVPSWS